MTSVLNVILDVFLILLIVVVGTLVIVFITDLILCAFDGHKGIFFNRDGDEDSEEDRKKQKEEKKSRNKDLENDEKVKESDKESKDDTRDVTIDDRDVVVYNISSPDSVNDDSEEIEKEEKDEVSEIKEEYLGDDVVTAIDYDKALEEQKAIQNKNGARQAVVTPVNFEEETKPSQTPTSINRSGEVTDEDFEKILDDVTKQALSEIRDKRAVNDAKTAKEMEEKNKELLEAQKELEAYKQEVEAKKKEIAELKKAKDLADLEEKKVQEMAESKSELAASKKEYEQKQKELEELEEKTTKKAEAERNQKSEELERLEELLKEYKEEIKATREEIKEIKKYNDIDELQEKKSQELLEAKDALKDSKREVADKQKEIEQLKKQLDETKELKSEPKIVETIIKDDGLKYANIARMNVRLANIVSNTSKVEKEQLLKQQESGKKTTKETTKKEPKLVSRSVVTEESSTETTTGTSKQFPSEATASLNQGEEKKPIVKSEKDTTPIKTNSEEKVNDTAVEAKKDSKLSGITFINRTLIKSEKKESSKPLFDKEYYQNRLEDLENQLKETEKELRQNKTEYTPLVKIQKAYKRDLEKLRKKEMVVAKQKMAIYGSKSGKIDPKKKEKVDANFQKLNELKDSVLTSEKVIQKNKDRFPILEKNNKLLTKQIERIKLDIEEVKNALNSYK